MAQERNRAADMGYDDPIHDTYEDTCSMYDQVVETVLQRVSHTPAEVMVASHNEKSVQLAVQRYGNDHLKQYTVCFKFVHTSRDLAARKQSHACIQETVAMMCNAMETVHSCHCPVSLTSHTTLHVKQPSETTFSLFNTDQSLSLFKIKLVKKFVILLMNKPFCSFTVLAFFN